MFLPRTKRSGERSNYRSTLRAHAPAAIDPLERRRLLAASIPDLANTSDTGVSDTDNITNATSLTFWGTAASNTLVRLLHNGEPVGQATSSGIGAWEINPTRILDNGLHAVQAAEVFGTTTGPLSQPL